MDNNTYYGTLATRLAGLQQRLACTAQPTGCRLIGASKMQPAALLEEAIRAGLVDFGENRVQETQGKWPALRATYPQVRLHLIGALQTNKAHDAVALFDVIHTVDRPKIAKALAEACEKEGFVLGDSHGDPERSERGGVVAGASSSPALKATPKFLIQVNTGEEPQKAGVSPRDAEALLAHCRALGLPVIGLMCVPPEDVNPAPHFALLEKMAREFGLHELSMGMSGDFETAARLGSTMVRIGTALFGHRPPSAA